MNSGQTVSSCNDLCSNTFDCASFEFGKKDFWKNRCDLYRKDCNKKPTHDFDSYLPCKKPPLTDGWIEILTANQIKPTKKKVNLERYVKTINFEKNK